MTRASGFVPSNIRQQNAERRLRHHTWEQPSMWRKVAEFFFGERA